MKLFAQLIGGVRVSFEIEPPCTVEALRTAIADAVGRPVGTFSLVSKGSALPDKPEAVVKLAELDVLLVVPQRKAPSERLVKAVVGRSDTGGGDEEDEPAKLPADAPRWEVRAVEALRRRKCPEWVLEWVVLLRPKRIAMLLLFCIACVFASKLGIGPVFILGGIMVTIFRNLGQRREGEASAYSIFNPGVQRLPGQLNADEIDRQMRNGQL